MPEDPITSTSEKHSILARIAIVIAAMIAIGAALGRFGLVPSGSPVIGVLTALALTGVLANYLISEQRVPKEVGSAMWIVVGVILAPIVATILARTITDALAPPVKEAVSKRATDSGFRVAAGINPYGTASRGILLSAANELDARTAQRLEAKREMIFAQIGYPKWGWDATKGVPVKGWGWIDKKDWSGPTGSGWIDRGNGYSVPLGNFTVAEAEKELIDEARKIRPDIDNLYDLASELSRNPQSTSPTTSSGSSGTSVGSALKSVREKLRIAWAETKKHLETAFRDKWNVGTIAALALLGFILLRPRSRSSH